MTNELIIDIVGYTGSFVLSFMALPQIYNIIKTKSSKDISYGMLFLLMIGYILFLVYGILIWSIPIMASISFSIMNASILLFLKYKYDKTSSL